MAIEDAALLAHLFSGASTAADLPNVGLRFQEVRLSRKLKVQEISLHNLHLYHLQDGDEQAKRDDPQSAHTGSSPIWNNTEDQAWLYGYDAATAVTSVKAMIDSCKAGNE